MICKSPYSRHSFKAEKSARGLIPGSELDSVRAARHRTRGRQDCQGCRSGSPQALAPLYQKDVLRRTHTDDSLSYCSAERDLSRQHVGQIAHGLWCGLAMSSTKPMAISNSLSSFNCIRHAAAFAPNLHAFSKLFGTLKHHPDTVAHVPLL